MTRTTIAAERLEHIIDLLRREHVVRTNSLSEQLQVSKMTIRRDLTQLEEMGICTRTHGGAMALDRSVILDRPYNERELQFLMEKRAIARRAAEMIDEGDLIAIDSGSTTLQLTKEIKKKQNITIVTNSVLILTELADQKNIKVISTAGELSKAPYESLGQGDPCLVGPLAESIMKRFRPSKAFMATTGLTLTDGLSNSVMDQATMKQIMIEVSAKVVLLSDHSKFGHVAASIVGPVTLIDCVITDTGIFPEFEKGLKELGIQVIKVDPS